MSNTTSATRGRYTVKRSGFVDGPKWFIIDTVTNTVVDEAETSYEANLAAQGWRAGAYTATATD